MKSDPTAILPPEIRALLGIYALHSRIEDVVDTIKIDPPLSRNERHFVALLTQPQRMGDMAKLLNCLPSTMTVLVDALSEKGMVCRQPDPSDRRASQIILTPEGEKIQRKLLQFATDKFNAITGLDAEKIRQLANLLDEARTSATTSC